MMGIVQQKPHCTRTMHKLLTGYNSSSIYQNMRVRMRRFMLILPLCFCSLSAWAQAPVEERQVKQPAQRHSQQKADYARREKDKAAADVRQAESELAEAQQAQQAAEKNLQAAQQRTAAAQKKLGQAQAQHQQAQSRAAQTEAEVGRAWGK